MAAIDAMVAAGSTLSSVGANLSANPTHAPAMTFNSDSGITEVHGEYATPVPGQAPTPVHDNNSNLQAEATKLEGTVTSLQTQLDAHSFDPKSGEKVFTAQGDARDRLQVRLNRATEAASYFADRAIEVQAQRQAGERARISELNERAATAAFTAGNPARAEALAEALLREEADQAAKLFVSLRKGNR
jgi:hypothetical protein